MSNRRMTKAERKAMVQARKLKREMHRGDWSEDFQRDFRRELAGAKTRANRAGK